MLEGHQLGDSVASGVSVAVFHRRSRPSRLPEISRPPSGESTRLVTE